MYLKKLYRQSKFWFVIVVLLAISQLFINYKNGVEVSPFYHYGMFSLPFHFTPTYQCVEVRVNGKRLQTKDFTPNGWDNIVMPTTQYNNQPQWNSTMYNQTISRLIHIHDSAFYTYHIPQEEFDSWYHNRVLRLLNISNAATDVQYSISTYKQQNGTLVK